jgi:hypothetical protein
VAAVGSRGGVKVKGRQRGGEAAWRQGGGGVEARRRGGSRTG